ncbi:hypothetical protein LCGC14_3165890 [marine sediment metagenome]|uniref:Uncharacterized protein n=1 Tax=marine sediment metagenome TaxID=412755 RepID=A0A0F8VLB9_9ZZZZ
MRKRDAEKLKIGDKVFAPTVGIYANDIRQIRAIRTTDPDPRAAVPLFLLEGESNDRYITYFHLQPHREKS